MLSGLQRWQIRINQVSLRQLLAGLLLTGIAVAASSQRIVVVPGVEFYLGPLFYLIAYRMGGLPLALGVAVLVMAPTLGWWGHPYSIGIALCHLLFIHALRHRIPSLLQASALFYITVGGVLNFAVMWHLHNPPAVVGALLFTRKLLNDLLLAGFVDLLCAFVVIELQPFRLLRRRTISLRLLMLAGTPLSLIGAMAAVFVADVRQFKPTFAAYQESTMLRAEIHWLEGLYAGRVPGGLVPLPTAGNLPELMFLDADPLGARQAEVMKSLGCSLIDDGSPVIGAEDRNTFVFWLNACQSRRVGVVGESFYLVYSTRHVAEQAYREVIFKLIELIPVLVMAFGLQLFMLYSLGRSLGAWSGLVKRFGQPDLEAPSAITLREFVAPAANFVKANNDYVELVTERRRVGEALTDLSRGIDLRLLSDIRFEAETGHLSFVKMDLDEGSVPLAFTVHPGDRLAMTSADEDPQAVIELRIPGVDVDDWHLLMARGLTARGHWQSGCIIRLHQAKVTQDRMLHQARLIELGGMASALGHELKQPLFTIALAAENGTYQLADDDRPGTAKALAKFSRILDQVERAQTIIGRISRYARVDSPDEVFDLIEGVEAAMMFMRPLLVQEDVQVEVVDEMNGHVSVRMPRVGLEQIIVNAVQNAVDSIVTRRQAQPGPHPGAITIRCEHLDDGVTVEITDNGTGLSEIPADKLFEAFVTTKSVTKGTGLGLYISRQIMMEAGGTIELASRPPPQIGAVVSIRFNTKIPVDVQAEAA